MGLLDNFSEFVKTPEGQGVLAAAFGGLATAHRGTPINNIGKAGMAGLLGYSNAQDRARQAKEAEFEQQYKQYQLEEMRRKQTAPQYEKVGNTLLKFGPDGTPVPVYQAQAEEKLPWYVRRGENGALSIDPAYADLEKTKASFGRPPAQPMAPVAYVDPATGKTIWGTITDARGKPAANFSPMIQGQIAGAKESGKEQATAASQLPKAISNGEEAIRLSDELLNHPGFKQAVGASSIFGVQKIPGTDAKDFMNRLSQVKGGAFLTAFEALKGGGQITQIEGEKATDAIARMDNATSEQEFVQAVKDYKAVIKKAVNNAKLRAGKTEPVSPEQNKGGQKQGGVKFLGFE